MYDASYIEKSVDFDDFDGFDDLDKGNGGMDATINDVAKMAGVSVSTVSYSLSGNRPISNLTRERVLTAAQELGYRTGRVKFTPTRTQTRTFALLLPALQESLSMTHLDFFRALASEAYAEGFLVLLSSGQNQCEEIMNLSHSKVVDGIILMEVTVDDPRVKLLRELNLPFVVIGRPNDTKNITYVDSDFQEAMASGVRYLYDLGHREIAYFGYANNVYKIGYGPAVRAKLGYMEACRLLSLKSRAVPTSFDSVLARETAKKYIEQNPDVTAIIVQNELAMHGVLSAIKDLNLRVPHNISIIGVSSQSYFNSHFPKINFISLPLLEMCKIAVQMLIKNLDISTLNEKENFITVSHIEERGSCKKVNQ